MVIHEPMIAAIMHAIIAAIMGSCITIPTVGWKYGLYT